MYLWSIFYIFTYRSTLPDLVAWHRVSVSLFPSDFSRLLVPAVAPPLALECFDWFWNLFGWVLLNAFGVAWGLFGRPWGPLGGSFGDPLPGGLPFRHGEIWPLRFSRTVKSSLSGRESSLEVLGMSLKGPWGSLGSLWGSLGVCTGSSGLPFPGQGLFCAWTEARAGQGDSSRGTMAGAGAALHCTGLHKIANECYGQQTPPHLTPPGWIELRTEMWTEI